MEAEQLLEAKAKLAARFANTQIGGKGTLIPPPNPPPTTVLTPYCRNPKKKA